MSEESDLRAGIDDRVAAVRTGDVERLLAHYAADVVIFDLVEPLAHRGLPSLRKRVEQWFGSFDGAIDYEVRDITLHVAGNLAFEHHLTHVQGKSRAGQRISMWFRESVGLEKSDGGWKVVHQHSSVPIDMANGKGQFDLQP